MSDPTSLILASTSKYRNELMHKLAKPFTAMKPLFDEDAAKNLPLPPAELCVHLGREKARSLASSTNCVIGSDQMAVIGNEILGKPFTVEAACAQLAKLQGRTHELLTSVSIFYHGVEHSHLNTTRITFRNLNAKEIADYVSLDHPLDCAASYKMELHGIRLVQNMQCEDFTAIQGLPLIWVNNKLAELGL